MKSVFIIFGILTAVAVMFISYSSILEKHGGENFRLAENNPSPQFKWTEVAPPGSGTHQYEWKPGTYPSAIPPILGMNDELWMIGQKKCWSSKDGIKWMAYDKTDWGERISTTVIFFKDKLWVIGGMEYSTNLFLNEIWSSSDGKTWSRAVEHAEWTPRKGVGLVVFNNKLWLFGGAINVNDDKSSKELTNDIWSSTDGLQWIRESDTSPWTQRENPKVVVFKEKLWMIGLQGNAALWNTKDGKRWTEIKSDPLWKERYDYGVHVFDNLMWMYGGRERDARNAHRDVWFSVDGSHWRLQCAAAPWTPRSGGNSVVFKNKLWLYGGKHTGHNDSFSGDIWTMESL